MGDFYIEEQRMIHDAARAFATERLVSSTAQWGRDGALPDRVVCRIDELGLLDMIVPAEWGGSYTDYVVYALALEEVAAGCAANAAMMSVHNSVGYGPTLKFGAEAQRARYLPDLATGHVISTFCLAEPHADSEANNLRTRTVLRDGRWVLTGNKQFVANGARADIAIVLVVTDPDADKRGISAFIVSTDTPGFHAGRPEHKLDTRASDICPITLEDCAVPEGNLLGKRGEGLKVALLNLEDGRIGIVAQAVGIARAALDAVRNYANERIQFSKTLRKHQTIANILADMATRLDATHLLVHHAAYLHSADKPCLSEASQAKLYASELAEEICSNAIQVHGGYDYLADYAVEHHYCNARITRIYEGTNEVQRMVVARHVQHVPRTSTEYERA